MEKLNKVIADLGHRRGDWPGIAKSAGVSYSWITKFANRKIPNPGILTVERISDALKRV